MVKHVNDKLRGNVLMPDAEFNRLRWQCRRGMLELDLLLEGFLNSHFAILDGRLRKDFSALLGLPDQTLQQWLFSSGDGTEVQEPFREIVGLIRGGDGAHGKPD